jgi:hypothetical protein
VLAGLMRSAIQVTTACSLCALLDLLAEGKLVLVMSLRAGRQRMPPCFGFTEQ